METFEMILLSIWAAAFALFALLSCLKNAGKQHDELCGFPLHELTVIIPFRNEIGNLEPLCDSILKQKVLPKKIIFVDDHSDDGGGKLIDKKLINSQIPYEIILLEGAISGKKHALMTGVYRTTTKYCQTIDADVWFESDFFQNLPMPKNFEMQILPVRMVGTTRFTKLLELEYGSFQILQGLVHRENPLMASGANLIFSKDAYLEYNKLEVHAHRSSGDDQYALAQFIHHKRKITTYFDAKLAVYTKTPQSVGELYKQRIRWMGNNTQGNDQRATFFSVLILFLNTSFLAFLIYFASKLSFQYVSLIFGLKCTFDFLLYLGWFSRNKTIKLIFYLPFLSLLYPIYLIFLPIIFLIHGKSVQWKNRSVVPN